MVSLVIGKRGRQISNFMADSGSRITVSQQNRDGEAMYRSVEFMADNLDCIKKGVKLVIKHVELMLCKKQNIDYRKRPQIDKNADSSAKLVLPKDAEPSVIGENGVFLRALSKEFDVSTNHTEHKENKTIENNESLLVALLLLLEDYWKAE